jgi:hypothetical protein
MKNTTCIEEGCSRSTYTRGYCKPCYAKHWKKRDIVFRDKPGRWKSPPRFCNQKNCEKQVIARDMCGMHYRRWARTGTTELIKRTCIECDEPHLAKGLCRKHYSRRYYKLKRSAEKKSTSGRPLSFSTRNFAFNFKSVQEKQLAYQKAQEKGYYTLAEYILDLVKKAS